MLLRLWKCLEIILFVYIVSVAYGQMFVMVPILSQCALTKNGTKQAIFDKKLYNFQINHSQFNINKEETHNGKTY